MKELFGVDIISQEMEPRCEGPTCWLPSGPLECLPELIHACAGKDHVFSSMIEKELPAPKMKQVRPSVHVQILSHSIWEVHKKFSNLRVLLSESNSPGFKFHLPFTMIINMKTLSSVSLKFLGRLSRILYRIALCSISVLLQDKSSTDGIKSNDCNNNQKQRLHC